MSKHRKFSGSKIVIASHNSGKVVEIEDLLKPYGIKCLSAAGLNLDEPVEDGTTFTANAEIKARAASLSTKQPSLSDDSGLVIPSINGDPGIYSARWAGKDKDFNLAMCLVEKRLQNVSDRRAYFFAALALCWPDGHCETFTGRIDGELTWPPRGKLGFGYDPMFIPTGFKKTFGEIEPALKHTISHRSKAFAKLVEFCFGH